MSGAKCHYCGQPGQHAERRCWHVPHEGCGWKNVRSRRRVPVCLNHAFGLRLECVDDDQ